MAKPFPVILRYIYLYLVTLVAIVLVIVAAIGFVRLVLNEYVFDVKGWEEIEATSPYVCEESQLFRKFDPKGGFVEDTTLSAEEKAAKKADCLKSSQERAVLTSTNSTKRDLVWWISMLVVALPIYLYHWGLIKKSKHD